MQQPCGICGEPFDTDDRELCCFCMKADGMCTKCLTKHEDECAEALELTPCNPDEPQEDDFIDSWEELQLERKHEQEEQDGTGTTTGGTEGLGDPAGDGGDCIQVDESLQ